jgi:vitamin B12 transporter
MHKRINKIGLILVIGLGMASSTLLAGDEDTEASENMLPEFELPPYVAVVTRTPLPLDKVSPSVSYISEAEMIQNQDRSIVDVLARQPGVIINTSGTKGGLSSLFMRGTNSDHTGFFLDGRRLNPGFSNQFDLEFLSIDNLSSVEVQRGASSVNYGSAGIGGVVSLQTRSDLGEKTESVTAEAELGSYDSYRGALNASFSDEDWALSLGASAFTTENKRNNDDFETLNLNGRFEYQLTEYLTGELVGFVSKSEKGLPDVITNQNDIDSSEIETGLISPGLRYKNGNLSGQVFYSKSKQTLDTESLETGFSFPFVTEIVNAGSVVESDEFYAQLDSEFDGGVISLGALYRNDEIESNNLDFFNPSAPARPFFERFEQIGFWSQIQWQIADALEVRLGGRYDRYTDFDSSFNGSVEVLYSFTDFGTVVFAKLATSSAPPSALDVAFDGDPIGTALNPEESTSYEIGAKQRLLSSSLLLSAVVFRNEIDDLIGFAGSDAFNVNRATTEGIEFTAQYAPIDILDLGLSYTYLTALNNETGKRLLRRPRHILQASAWLTPISKLDIGLTATGYFDREDAIFGPPPTFSTLQINQEDYFVVDIRADYQLTEYVTFFARVENLLDEVYDSVLGFPALGRTGSIGARLTF